MSVAQRVGDVVKQAALIFVEVAAIGTESAKILVTKLDDALDEIQGKLKE